VPELPEVQTIVTGLDSQLAGNVITDVTVYDEELLRNTNEKEIAKRLIDKTLEKVSRKGKYILLEVEGDSTVAIHLRMSGRMLVRETGLHTDYERISFVFGSRKKQLIMDNVRRLGTLDLLDSKENDPLVSLGLDPFSDEYNWENFQNIFTTTRPVKLLLLDQKKVAGIGNIYASEILFRSGISPKIPGNEVSTEQKEILFKMIPQVLSEAITNNGTTLNDYRDSSGDEGSFQDFLRVYGKESEGCPKCGTEIQRIQQGGRSTFYCPNCQQGNDN